MRTVTKGPPALTRPPGVSPQTANANLPEHIHRAKTELKRLGCIDGMLDGRMDTTVKAIKVFLKHSHKPVVPAAEQEIADRREPHVHPNTRHPSRSRANQTPVEAGRLPAAPRPACAGVSQVSVSDAQPCPRASPLRRAGRGVAAVSSHAM